MEGAPDGEEVDVVENVAGLLCPARAAVVGEPDVPSRPHRPALEAANDAANAIRGSIPNGGPTSKGLLLRNHFAQRRYSRIDNALRV
jgi:hypothetical protein